MAATYDEAVTAYLDNADFEESSSLSKARAFVTACVQLSVLLPASASDQSSAHSFDISEIRDNKQRAQNYISANAQGASVRFLNVGNFRG